MADERIYQTDDGQSFFRVRGNQNIGPFSTEAQAREKLCKRVVTWVDRTSMPTPWLRAWRRTRSFRHPATPQS